MIMKKVMLICLSLILILSMTICSSYADAGESSEYKKSEILTYEELVRYHAEKKGLSEQEAISDLAQKGIVEQNGNSRATGTRYQIFTQSVKVNASYKPEIDFYCEVSYWNSYWGIVGIYNVELNRTYNGMTKRFDGTVKYWLRSAYQIEWVINGDFYNYGTTTTSIGGTVNVGESGTLSCSVSSSSNFYATVYKNGTLEVQ